MYSGFTFILGGARSGKSSYAIDLAKCHSSGRVVYLATCEPKDDREMQARIKLHKKRRPKSWQTIEAAPDDVIPVINSLTCECLILDCLTLLVSNLLLKGLQDRAIQRYIKKLRKTIREATYPVIVVSNDVGSGVVPNSPLGRRFRDLAGLANQLMAAYADDVYLMVAGIPVKIK